MNIKSDIEKIVRDTATAFLNRKYPSAHPLNWNLKLIDTIENDISIAYLFKTHIPVPEATVGIFYDKEKKLFYAC